MAIITVEQLKRSLRIHHTEEDELLADIADQSTAIVLSHIKKTETDDAANHQEVRAAAVLVGSRIYEYPEGVDDQGREVRWLSSSSRALLEPHRKPTLA